MMFPAMAATLVGSILPATAGESAGLEARKEGQILWIDATLPETEADRIVIVLLRPSNDGFRSWNRCSFSYSGAGVYSCGADRAELRRHRGTWLARLLVDGERAARLRFQV